MVEMFERQATAGELINQKTSLLIKKTQKTKPWVSQKKKQKNG